MRILFICGSLQQSKDGVGDYTRRLAAEMVRLGHEAFCLAFCDRYISETLEELQVEQGYPIDTLRISKACGKQQRDSLAKQWTDAKDPDWISLQYVPFAFHPKGLPFGLENELAFLGKGRKWHIMFHELWVGMNKGSGVKEIIWGKLQRFTIRRMLLHLQPMVIHTNTKLYCKQLALLGFSAEQLPLFSNIPIYKSHITESKKSDSISMVIFGGIYPGAPIEDFALEVAAYEKRTERRFLLSILGRSGREQNHWVEAWKAAGLDVEVLGEQSPEDISRKLKNSDVGIATTPYLLSEKSGSIAAMREHGLPIISVSQNWKSRIKNFVFADKSVFAYRPSNFASFIHKYKEDISHYDVSEASRTFIQSLK